MPFAFSISMVFSLESCLLLLAQPQLETLNNAREIFLWPRNCTAASGLDENFPQLRAKSNV